MLNTPSAYGQPDSWALYEALGETHAARIVRRPGPSTAVISLADQPMNASGNLTVPMAELLDPTPLSAEERAEMAEIGRRLNHLARPERSGRFARHHALHMRQIRAEAIVAIFERLERRRLATPATREARRLFEAALAEAAGDERRAA